MIENTRATMPMGQLRLKFAVNRFKHFLLGDQHEPRKPQTDSVLDKIGEKLKEEELPWSGRTWQAWFSKTPSIPKLGKIQYLDQVAELFNFNGDQGLENMVSIKYFSSMVHGGILQTLLVPTKSKHVINTLRERASDYVPASPIHLHLDAIEVSGWTKDFTGITWSEVTSIAARRIMEILAERWSPRYGKLYDTFSSVQRLEWDDASSEERDNIRKLCDHWHPYLFEKLMNAGATPDWSLLGCNDDIAPAHIYKLLFSMAADPGFLVKDRFESWYLDMATAALALHALAWVDRYDLMGQSTYEKFYWGGFDEIFFDEDPLQHDKYGSGISDAMVHCGAEWQPDSFDIFCKARDKYHELIKDGGLSIQEVMSVAMAARSKYPLRYG